ncbi:MAG TPA: diguanylate cyclase, partial [Rubrivivax sp.]|nr:diguanylate cyclase [Rubrivivax sp.]
MTPVRTRIPQPPAEAAPSLTLAARRLPLGRAVLLVAVTAALLAALAALLLQAGFGASAPWAAVWGALLGVAGAALPFSMLALRPASAVVPAGAPAPETARPDVGTLTPRALFLEWAEREWARSRRYGTAAALLLVDVDRYGRLCDARGAGAGAAVLAELLRCTATTLRGADALTRFGDGQMAVFLAQADATGALDVAERIRER